MTDTRIKSQIGLFIVISHVLIVLLTGAYGIKKWFLPEEMKTIIALLSPILGVYAAAVVKYFTVQRYQKGKGCKVRNEFAVLTYFIVFVFIGCIALVITLSALNLGFTYEQTLTTIAAIETAFGGYFSIVLSSLFEIKSPGDAKSGS